MESKVVVHQAPWLGFWFFEIFEFIPRLLGHSKGGSQVPHGFRKVVSFDYLKGYPFDLLMMDFMKLLVQALAWEL